MEKEESAVEKFLKGTNESMFEQPESPLDAPLEQKEEVVEEEVIEEKPLPFHKDPKVQKFIEKEVGKRLHDFKPTETERQNDTKNDELVESLIAVIGNDTPEKRKVIETMRDRIDEGTRKITEWENEQRQADIEDKEAEEELENAFEAIGETYEVDLNSPRNAKLKSDFISFVEKIAPKDRRTGEIIDYPDMNSAWETFEEINKASAQPSRRKELANRSLSRSTTATQSQAKRIDWNAVDEMMDGLPK